MDDHLIEVIAREEKILKYLDIPLQHCNDNILRRMNRRGDRAAIEALLDKLRERIPGLVLRTSIITGLPGEDEAAFDELCQFLWDQRMLRAGVFPYSPEEGTPAAGMDRVDEEEAARRAELVVDIQSRIMDEWNEEMQGRPWRSSATGSTASPCAMWAAATPRARTLTEEYTLQPRSRWRRGPLSRSGSPGQWTES